MVPGRTRRVCPATVRFLEIYSFRTANGGIEKLSVKYDMTRENVPTSNNIPCPGVHDRHVQKVCKNWHQQLFHLANKDWGDIFNGGGSQIALTAIIGVVCHVDERCWLSQSSCLSSWRNFVGCTSMHPNLCALYP